MKTAADELLEMAEQAAALNDHLAAESYYKQALKEAESGRGNVGYVCWCLAGFYESIGDRSGTNMMLIRVRQIVFGLIRRSLS